MLVVSEPNNCRTIYHGTLWPRSQPHRSSPAINHVGLSSRNQVSLSSASLSLHPMVNSVTQLTSTPSFGNLTCGIKRKVLMGCNSPLTQRTPIYRLMFLERDSISKLQHSPRHLEPYSDFYWNFSQLITRSWWHAYHSFCGEHNSIEKRLFGELFTPHGV